MAVNLFDLYAKISLDDTQFNAGIGKALASGNTLAAKIGSVFTGISNVGKTAFKAIGVAVTAGATALGGFMKSAIDAGQEFDAAMSQVKAISGATGEDFTALRDKAMEMGAKTKFSATESAEAMNYMAMAGWKTEDMLNGIEGVMNLAAASGEDLATTSDIVTDAMTAFGMSADQSSHFADVLAASAANSNTNVSMLGDSFKYVAPVAGSMGYSVEDTAIALGLMANNGIKASQGGTALRNILTNMANPSKNMAKAIDVLGLSLTDADGNMLSLVDIMRELRSSFSSGAIETEKIKSATIELAEQYDKGEISIDEYNQKTNELAESVFNAAGANKAQYASMLAGKYGMAGLLAIVNTTDEDFEKLTSSIYNCTGAAEEMANTMLDNLSGDVTIFKSALEGLKITISDSVTPSLRNFVQFGTDSINKVKEAFTSGGWEAAINVVSQVLAQMLNQFIAFIPQIANIAVQFVSTFVSNIGSNIGTITTAANQILQAFVSGFGQIFNQLMPIITQLVPTIANYIMTYKAQMFQIGLQIIVAVAQGIAQNASQIGSSGAQIIKSVISSISTGLSSLIRSGAQILASIAQGISSNINNIMTYGSQVVQGFIVGVSRNISSIGQSGMQIIAGLASGIQSAIPKVLQLAPTIFTKFLQTLSSGISQFTNIGVQLINSLAAGLKTGIPNFLSQALPMLVQFTANLRQNAGKLVDAGLNLIKNMAQGIAKGIPDLVRNIPTIVSNIAGIINDNAPKILATGVQIIVTLGKGLIQAIPTIVANIPKILKAIVDVFTAFNWLNLGKNIIEGLVKGVKSMVSAAGNGAKNIFDAITNVIKDLPNKLLEFGKNGITSLVKGIKSMISSAKTSAANILDVIINVIKQLPSKLLELGKNAISDLAQGIKEGINLIKNVAQLIWNTIINALKELPNKVLEIGKNIISGLWKGIQSGVGWLSDKIKGFVGSIMNIFTGKKDGFDSHSPSRWAERLFENVLEGAGIGLDNGKRELFSNVESIANEVKDRMNLGSLYGEYGNDSVVTSNMGSAYNSGDEDTVTEYNMQVTINLNGSDYTSQRQIAEAISVQLQNLVNRRSAAWA